MYAPTFVLNRTVSTITRYTTTNVTIIASANCSSGVTSGEIPSKTAEKSNDRKWNTTPNESRYARGTAMTVMYTPSVCTTSSMFDRNSLELNATLAFSVAGGDVSTLPADAVSCITCMSANPDCAWSAASCPCPSSPPPSSSFSASPLASSASASSASPAASSAPAPGATTTATSAACPPTSRSCRSGCRLSAASATCCTSASPTIAVSARSSSASSAASSGCSRTSRRTHSAHSADVGNASRSSARRSSPCCVIHSACTTLRSSCRRSLASTTCFHTTANTASFTPSHRRAVGYPSVGYDPLSSRSSHSVVASYKNCATLRSSSGSPAANSSRRLASASSSTMPASPNMIPPSTRRPSSWIELYSRASRDPSSDAAFFSITRGSTSTPCTPPLMYPTHSTPPCRTSDCTSSVTITFSGSAWIAANRRGRHFVQPSPENREYPSTNSTADVWPWYTRSRMLSLCHRSFSTCCCPMSTRCHSSATTAGPSTSSDVGSA